MKKKLKLIGHGIDTIICTISLLFPVIVECMNTMHTYTILYTITFGTLLFLKVTVESSTLLKYKNM